MIRGRNIYLRAVLPSDAPLILNWENNPEFWHITEHAGPFQLEDIQKFIEDSCNLHRNGQLRYMILNIDKTPIGAVDLFDYRHQDHSAGIGVLIADHDCRGKGHATDAILTLLEHLRKTQEVRVLNCIIFPDNIASIKLFLRCGFLKTGVDLFKGKVVNRYQHKL